MIQVVYQNIHHNK